jgi:outer membrane protein TolC
MKTYFIILMILMMSIFCFAQETISLEDVRNLALANSRTLAEINLSLQSSALDEKADNFKYLPSLSLGASASASLWGDQSIIDSFDAGANLSITESITIWNGGRNTLLKEITNIATERTRQEALAAYFSVLDAADKAYYRVLETQASLDLANLSLENSAMALSIAEIRRESGMLNITDLLQAQADYESRKTSVNQAKGNLSLALASLKSITKLSELPNLQTIDFANYNSLIEKLSQFSDEAMNNLFAELRKVLSAKNPDYSIAALSLQSAEQNLNLASKDYYPSVSASVSTGLGYTYKNGFDLSDSRVTLSASIPLDFWATANSVQKEKIAQQRSLLGYEDTQTQFDIDVQTGILNCITQAGTVISSQKTLEYTEKNYESVLELYRLSQKSVSELATASTSLSSTRNQLINAQYSFLSCLSVIRSLGAFESDQDVIDFLSENQVSKK